MPRGNDDEIMLKLLVENPRISIRKMSALMGVNYMSIREKLRRLVDKGVIRFHVSVPASVAGSHVGIIRIRGGDGPKLREFAALCNRVLSYVSTNGGDSLILIYGKEKSEVMKVIDTIKSLDDKVLEVEVEFGRLPPNIYIPIKNGGSGCTIGHCRDKCLPSLRK